MRGQVRLKPEVAPLLKSGLQSLVRAIDDFNTTGQQRCAHGVVLMTHHAVEMLLKAIIRQRTGRIRKPGEQYTYGFAHCLETVARTLHLVTDDERKALVALDGQRDVVMHYFADIPEELLYVHLQTTVSLFDRLLLEVFGQRLADRIPVRVMPVSTRPPAEVLVLFDEALSQIDVLLTRHQRGQATARLRAWLPWADAHAPEGARAARTDPERVLRQRLKGDAWTEILPALTALRLGSEAGARPMLLKVSKEGPLTARIVKPGEVEPDVIIGTKEINIWDKYTLPLKSLAAKLEVTQPRLLALIYDIGLQENPECFHHLRCGKVEHKRYSPKALDVLREALKTRDMGLVWVRQAHRLGKKAGGRVA